LCSKINENSAKSAIISLKNVQIDGTAVAIYPIKLNIIQVLSAWHTGNELEKFSKEIILDLSD